MPYATQLDLQNIGLPPQAFGQLEQNQINAALQNASDLVDSYLRARYGTSAVPLIAWDSTITKATARLAAYELLVEVRGVNPESTDFKILDNMRKLAEAYLDRIQRQQAHPNVTVAAANLPGSTQPNLISSSVISVATGQTGPNRGW